MNTFRVVINPYKDINTVSLDNKPLSPFSEINNFMKEPFLAWADKLLGAAEREINDDFSLSIVAETFDQLLLKDLQQDFESCIDYSLESFQLAVPTTNRYRSICSLAEKYSVQFTQLDDAINVYSEVDCDLPEGMVRVASPSSAFVCVTNNQNIIRSVRNNNRTAIILVISERSNATSLGNAQFLWEIERERLSKLLGAISDRYYRIPQIVRGAELLNSKKESMLPADIEALDLTTSIDMFISIDDITPIEVGNEYSITLNTIPQSSHLPELRIVSSNPNIVSVDGMKLRAVAPGKAFLDFYKLGENIPFARKNVSTFRNNLVQEIRLSVCERRMSIGHSQKVTISMLPSDAEDSNQITWSSDSPNIATVDANGNIWTHSAGSAIITASTSKVKNAIAVEVLPNISRIALSTDRIALYVGQTHPIRVEVEPKDCFDNSVEWKTSDKDVAITEVCQDGEFIIRATGIGECTLSCTAKEGDCETKCSVKVESTFKKRENIHSMLSATLICVIASIFCGVFSFSLGSFIASVIAIVTGLGTIKQNKADRLWAFILMIISALTIMNVVTSIFK